MGPRRGNYITWQEGRPVAMDLYYDPVGDEHVSSPMGLMAPSGT
ncbi:MAG: hypothetical protein Ct9H300mP12_09920 [Acidimicrobiales bacterium]|nr:MAG: hypothetical protein Ct9H300mP12_09920 [Acidimicrobiales bacterium]